MKAIELTEEHKSKLLEMCKALFPEYDKEINLEIEPDYEGLQNFIQFRKKYENCIFIHWFEFCMTHLSNKLELLLKLDLIHSFYSFNEQVNNNNHIIDYLYEEFKKLHPKQQYVNDHVASIMNIKITREK